MPFQRRWTRRSGSLTGSAPQQRLIDQREQRGVRADPEREREEGGDREHGTAPQRAERVAEVAGAVVDPAPSPRLAHVFAHLHDAAEFERRPASRLGVGEARVGLLSARRSGDRGDRAARVRGRAPSVRRREGHRLNSRRMADASSACLSRVRACYLDLLHIAQILRNNGIDAFDALPAIEDDDGHSDSHPPGHRERTIRRSPRV